MILPDRFTLKYGINKGDTIHLQINGATVPLQAADIANYDTVFLRHTRGATALLPLSTMAGLLDQTDGYSEILIKPAAGADTAVLKNEISAALPAPAYIVSEVVNEAQIAADARQKSMPFFLISFFSMTMSVFIIYSSYKVITLDRLPVIGTFRSIGAEKKTVTRIFLLESLLYGSAGGLLGIPLGIVVLKLILHGMGQSLSQGIEIPAVISPLSAVISFTMAVSVAFLSAWLPIRRAGRLPAGEGHRTRHRRRTAHFHQIPYERLCNRVSDLHAAAPPGIRAHAVPGRRPLSAGNDCIGRASRSHAHQPLFHSTHTALPLPPGK